MGRYDFHSTGAAVSGALEQFLTEQKAEQRQAMLDELNKQNVQSQMADRVMNRKIQEEGIQSSVAQRAALADASAVNAAQKIAEITRTGADMTPDSESALVNGHMGHLVQKPTIQQVEAVPTATASPDMLNAGVSLPASKFSGTVKQDQFDESLALKATIAQLAAEHKARTDEIMLKVQENNIDHKTALLMMQQENSNVSNRLKEAEIQAKAEKSDALKTAADEKAHTVKMSRAGVRDLADEIKNDKHLDKVIGPMAGWAPSILPESKDLDSRISRLVNMLSLESRGQLKGSGAISDFEARMLQSAATSLNQRTNSEIFKKELQRIIDASSGDRTRDMIPGYNENGDLNGAPVFAPGNSKPNPRDLWKKYGGT